MNSQVQTQGKCRQATTGLGKETHSQKGRLDWDTRSERR